VGAFSFVWTQKRVASLLRALIRVQPHELKASPDAMQLCYLESELCEDRL